MPRYHTLNNSLEEHYLLQLMIMEIFETLYFLKSCSIFDQNYISTAYNNFLSVS
jgi:hypothetical protein